ncbi:MAG: hypothetical protein SFY81_03535 [Verrucomicrobiota bacterium]|nr:hypothetical protein [Verrucomicrobiota bacterium]
MKGLGFCWRFLQSDLSILNVTVETFRPEINDALKSYDKYIVCLDKTPEECESSLISLMEKAIKAYQHRGPNLRHGIALDKQVTIILSQTEGDRPLCGIYFNLSSPYHKRHAHKDRVQGKVEGQ